MAPKSQKPSMTRTDLDRSQEPTVEDAHEVAQPLAGWNAQPLAGAATSSTNHDQTSRTKRKSAEEKESSVAEASPSKKAIQIVDPWHW